MSFPRDPADKPSGVEWLAAESFKHHCPASQQASKLVSQAGER